jgi:hypothetical protein
MNPPGLELLKPDAITTVESFVNRRRTFSPDRLAKGTPLVAVPLGERASRSDRAATRALATWKSGAVLETPGFVAGLDDVAVMSEC